MSTLLIIVLVLLLVGAFGAAPWYGHSQNWGYGPSGGIGLLVLILLILALLGRL